VDKIHVSAWLTRGSINDSSSSMRSQTTFVFDPDFNVASRAITNCVQDVIAFCDWRKTSQACLD
jgi:hypothetical protein